MFNIQHCRVFVVEGAIAYRFDQTGVKLDSDVGLGILGDAIENKKLTNTVSPYSTALYNKQVAFVILYARLTSKPRFPYTPFLSSIWIALKLWQPYNLSIRGE
jgi:hypothetical protein